MQMYKRGDFLPPIYHPSSKTIAVNMTALADSNYTIPFLINLSCLIICVSSIAFVVPESRVVCATRMRP